MAMLLAVVLFVGTAGAMIYHELSNSASTVDVSDLLDRTKKPVSSYDGREINILIIGSDTREGDGNHVDGYKDDTARSDTTLLMHISADRKRVQVISIPRDTMVDIPSCELSDGTMTAPQHAQFNWAFSVAPVDDLASAVACTWKTVEDFTGLTIDEYIVVDFHGFETMVDALDGINIFFDEPMQVKAAHIDIPQGCQHLDGQTALGYARAREGVGDGSDLSRIKRQQYLLSIMMRTAMNKSLLTDLPSLYQFLREGLKSLTLSPGLGDITTMAAIAYSLSDIDLRNMEFVTPPVAPEPSDPNRVVFTPKVDEIWDALATDSPLPAGFLVRGADGSERMTTGHDYDSSTTTSSKDTTDTTRGSQTTQDETTEPTNPETKVPGTRPASKASDPFAEERAKCEP